jgi:hypothetical protein
MADWMGAKSILQRHKRSEKMNTQEVNLKFQVPKALSNLWAERARLSRALLKQLIPNVGSVVLALVLFWVTSAQAAPWNAPAQSPGNVPMTINYQGRLADPDGTPIDNTDPGLGMTFSLYTQETGGSPVWSESHTGVEVSGGLFSVRLGSVEPLTTDLLTGDLWLGIKVGNDEEMSPREKLDAVPYAMQAGMAHTVPDGSIGADQIADDAVTLDKLGLGKYKFRRGGDDIVHYWGPSGQKTELDLSTCAAGEWCCNAEKTICYHYESGTDSILEFNLDGAPSLTCVLLHNEDDWPRYSQGIAYATDGGNQSHTDGDNAKFSREGVEGIPINNANYYWLCGW